MLEQLFQGTGMWGYELMMELWENFANAVMGIVALDMHYVRDYVPILDQISSILLATGWALLIGNLVFQALKGMVAGLGVEAENPTLLFGRTFLFSFLLVASPQICEIGLHLTQIIIDLLEVPTASAIQFPNNDTFGSLTAAWLLVIICGVIIMFRVIKMLAAVMERYVVLTVLTLCAPLAFAMGGSRSTSDIFTGWCRMMGSMCFLMVSNIIFFKLMLSVLSAVPSGVEVYPWMFLLFAIAKVNTKVDGIITRIGLNPAMTGDSLGRSLPGVLAYSMVRMAAKNVTKAAGNTFRTAGDFSNATSKNGPKVSNFAGNRNNSQTTNHSKQNTASQQNAQGTSTTNQTTQSTAQGQKPQGTTQNGTFSAPPFVSVQGQQSTPNMSNSTTNPTQGVSATKGMKANLNQVQPVSPGLQGHGQRQTNTSNFSSQGGPADFTGQSNQFNQGNSQSTLNYDEKLKNSQNNSQRVQNNTANSSSNQAQSTRQTSNHPGNPTSIGGRYTAQIPSTPTPGGTSNYSANHGTIQTKQSQSSVGGNHGANATVQGARTTAPAGGNGTTVVAGQPTGKAGAQTIHNTSQAGNSTQTTVANQQTAQSNSHQMHTTSGMPSAGTRYTNRPKTPPQKPQVPVNTPANKPGTPPHSNISSSLKTPTTKTTRPPQNGNPKTTAQQQAKSPIQRGKTGFKSSNRPPRGSGGKGGRL